MLSSSGLICNYYIFAVLSFTGEYIADQGKPMLFSIIFQKALFIDLLHFFSAVDKMRSFFWALRGSKKQQPPPVTEVKDSGKVNTEQVMPGHQPSLSTTTTSPNGSSSCSKQTSSSSQGQVLASQLQQLITEDACHGYEHDSTTVDPREAEN